MYVDKRLETFVSSY